MPDNRWKREEVQGLDDLDGLVYRSNLLGSDRTIVNFGGGNTSVKSTTIDHQGRTRDTLWVKGSGSDLASMDRTGFTPIALDEVLALRDRRDMSDEDMVEFLSHCMLNPGAPRPSIETMLHAFLPYKHVDHTHPEAAIALCCAENGDQLTRERFGDDIVWVPYVRPGFRLAALALEALESQPDAKGMFLAKHGLVTWGATGEESYTRTLDILSKAEIYLESRVDRNQPFGAETVPAARENTRRRCMVALLPVLRGILTRVDPDRQPVILHLDSSPEVMKFVCSNDLERLANTGAACPDHVMYTKFVPLVVPAEAALQVLAEENMEILIEGVAASIDSHVREYEKFFNQHASSGMKMLNPRPNVILIPGFGMVTVGRDAWTASNTASLYRTAISVMRWSSAVSTYTSLTSREAWDIEYWPLELYKLTLRPPPKEMAGRVAVITGGGGAIGQAVARRLLSEDAHVVLSDIDGTRAGKLATDLATSFGLRVLAVQGDSGNEDDTQRMTDEAILAFGGIDVMVPNAGIAAAGPIEDTEIEVWDAVHNVLLRGYFLACRSAFRVMKRQGLGGSIVINASKNGLAPGKEAIAYATAKAAEIHMTRCLAEEGGEWSIRVNAVAPDAVIQGSGLWSDEWRRRRAEAYGFPEEELEDYYRQRNALKVSIKAQDVAEAILFLASDRSSKTTGCILTVDGGVSTAYPR